MYAELLMIPNDTGKGQLLGAWPSPKNAYLNLHTSSHPKNSPIWLKLAALSQFSLRGCNIGACGVVGYLPGYNLQFLFLTSPSAFGYVQLETNRHGCVCISTNDMTMTTGKKGEKITLMTGWIKPVKKTVKLNLTTISYVLKCTSAAGWWGFS